MNRDEKAAIDALVDVWIDGILSSTHEAGWRGTSIIGKIMEYGCMLTAGNNNQADAGMINAIRLIRPPSPAYPRIAAAISILWEEKPDYIAAILAKCYYHGSRINETTGKPWCDEDRAAMINQDLHTYRYNLGKSYVALAKELARIDNYDSFRRAPAADAKNILRVLDNHSHAR